MPLPIRDGNQSLTTLSTLIVNSAHVPAHTVVSLGSQAITDIAQAVSGVELGPNTISALENISVTFGSGTSITVGNVVSVTGGLTNSELRASSVTIGGSVQVSNFPATQTTTFGAITGSVSVLNFPPTQTVTFTQAPVTFGQAVVSASNIGDILSGVGTDNTADATTKFFKIGGHQDGQNQISHIVHVSAGGAMRVDATDSSVTFGAISGTVTVGNSITISNFPATQAVTFTQASVTFGTPVVTGSVSVLNFPSTQTVAGTVTANLFGEAVGGGPNEPTKLQCDSNGFLITSLYRSGSDAVNYDPVAGNVSVNVKNVSSVTISSLPAIAGTVTVGGFSSVSVGSGALLIGGLRGGSVVGLPLDSASGNVSVQLRQTATTTNEPISQSNPLWVTQQGSVTIGSLPAISGTVTANAILQNANAMAQAFIDESNAYGSVSVVLSGSAGDIGVAGTVTAAAPNGSLTTRFGTPTTANVSFATSAVTNANRKYLLIQNVTTGSNVITVGIGFTPTTTQGIQLTAGAGITFESSYIPTGAVRILSSVTASNFTILEA
jgi:hypothetical protein